MGIEQVQMYSYRGRVFETRAKALDYAESLVTDLLKAPLLQRGFTISEWVKVCEVVLNNREELLILLDYSDETAGDHQ
jgi:hypothetical protein